MRVSKWLNLMVNPVGFEPTTLRLKVGCSTTELRVHFGGPGRIRTYDNAVMSRAFYPLNYRLNRLRTIVPQTR